MILNFTCFGRDLIKMGIKSIIKKKGGHSIVDDGGQVNENVCCQGPDQSTLPSKLVDNKGSVAPVGLSLLIIDIREEYLERGAEHLLDLELVDNRDELFIGDQGNNWMDDKARSGKNGRQEA